MKKALLLLFFAGLGSAPVFSQNKIQCTQPVIGVSANVTICNGSTTTLTGSVTTPTTADYTWAWTPTTGLGTPNTVGPALTNTTTASPTVTTTYTVIVTDQTGCTSNPVTVTVTVNSTPTVSISGANTICNGASTTLTASGGVSYVWSPGGSTTTSIVVTPTAASGYTVTGTNANSCTNTFSYNVSFFATPTVTVSGNNTVCVGSGTTLTATGASSYVWAPSGSLNFSNISNPVASPTTGTTYTVTGTDANSCTATATYSVSTSSVPFLTLSGTNTICVGSSTALNVSGASSYVWTPSGSLVNPNTSNPVASPTTSTNYSVVATGANGCTASSSYSVTVYATPTVSVSGTNTVCAGLPTTLSGSGGVSYVWSPGGATTTSIAVSPTTSANYTVTGTDANSCTNSATYSVTVYPQPVANAGPDVSVCAGDNTTLNGTGNGTFSWAPSMGLSCTTCPNPVSTPTAPVTYTLTVTNNCGTATDEISITYPALPSANAGPDVTICPGGSTTLTGTGSGTFIWSPAGTLSCVSCASPVATPTATSTTYTFSITASCGTNSDEVTVTIANPVASVTGNTTVCSGQPTTLTASGGVSYTWSTGAITNPIVENPTASTTYTVTATDVNGCTDSDVITVNPSPLPTANAGSDVSICSGSSTTLSATGSGTYAWAPATGLSCTTCANPTANPTATTNYTVTVTNNCGSATDSVLVSITTTPSVNAGADMSICAGGNASLNASGSGTYAWAPTTGLSCTTCANPVANPTGTTNYTVTITDACGTASDEVTVNVSSLPTPAIAGSGTICSGTSSTLSTTGGGTYLWTGGSTNDSLIVSPTVTTGYTVTVTSTSNCSGSATFTVNVSSVAALITGTSSTVCSGQSSTLTAFGGGTYVWSTGSTATNIIVTPTALTNYTVTATNGGCSGTATYAVNVVAQATASVTAASSTVCAGSVNSLNASGGTTYVWSPSTGLSNPNISNPISTATSNVTYTVIVSNGGCSDTANVGITVNALPTAVLSGTQASICIGSCNTLSATGGSTYVWAPGGATTSAITVCPTSAASYTVTATDSNGCTDDASMLIGVLPLVNANVTGDTVACMGDVIILTASGGGSYAWSNGATTSSITVNPITNSGYTVSISNGACSDADSINIIVSQPPSALATADPYTINIGATTTLTGATSTGTYTWSPTAGLSCDTCANPAANPTATTIYILTTVDSNGCVSSDTVIVNVTMECEEIFIPSAFSPNGDGFNDYLYVRNPCVRDMEFTIYNRWGQKVFYTTDITQGWDGNFLGKPSDPAVFFYKLNVNFITGNSKYQDGNITLVR